MGGLLEWVLFTFYFHMFSRFLFMKYITSIIKSTLCRKQWHWGYGCESALNSLPNPDKLSFPSSGPQS